MNLSEINKVHFVGVGGIGMSALARLFLNEGKAVSGSDRAPSELTRALEGEGVAFFSSQVAGNVTDDMNLVVYTEAVPQDHEELVRARELGIPTMNYFDALGMVANEYYLIAVAGSHGKTTTTAMLIDIFEKAGFDPSAIVGSLRAETKSNYRAGKSKYFIVEACEYKRDFLSLTPDVLIITNIEHEHVDCYANLGEVQMAFRDFAHRIRPHGVLIVNFSGENIAPVLEGVTARLIDYGKYFDPTLTLRVPGVHNHLNAAAARAAAEAVGITGDTPKRALEEFKGTWRRFEYKGELNGAPVYDDYGHHPTEIQATLQGTRELYPTKKLTLVFQPHTYSRTNVLFADFVGALAKADRVLILPIYAAREVNESGVTHTALADALREKGMDAVAFDTFDDLVLALKGSLSAEDVLLIMGAGTITEVTKKLFS